MIPIGSCTSNGDPLFAIVHGRASELGETDGSFGSSGDKDPDSLDRRGRRLGDQSNGG